MGVCLEVQVLPRPPYIALYAMYNYGLSRKNQKVLAKTED